MIRIIFSILVSCLLLYHSTSIAKCPLEEIVIEGNIFSSGKKPIENAILVVFLDDFQFGTSVKSDHEGRFTVKTEYKTFSGGDKYGDECNYKPSKMIIVAACNGFESQRINVPLNNEKSKDHVVISDIVLWEVPGT